MLSVLIDTLIKATDKSGLRQCSSCREYKSPTEFSIKDKKRGWLDTRCKKCKSTAVNEYQKLKRLKEYHESC